MTLVNGRAYKKAELLNEGTPVLRIQNLNGGSNWYYSNLELPENKYCENGDLLYAWSATFGPYNYSGPKAIYHYHIWKIIVHKNVIDKRFAYYSLLNITERVKNKAHGISMLHITKGKMEDMLIPLPPLPEQKRIAAILDAADQLRQKDRALIAKYEELTQSLFLEMFGDPVTNPMGLPKISLGELGKWKSGGTPSRRKPEYYTGEIPWLSSGELEKMYTSESKEKISKLALIESAAKLIETGSLLLGMYDTAALKSTITTVPLCCNQAIAFAKLDSEKVNPVYVYYIIQIGKEYYRRLQRGVRQKNLNLAMVKNIKILYPKIKSQNQFADRVQAIEHQKSLAQASLKKSEELFNSLLQKAFKGELTGGKVEEVGS